MKKEEVPAEYREGQWSEAEGRNRVTLSKMSAVRRGTERIWKDSKN